MKNCLLILLYLFSSLMGCESASKTPSNYVEKVLDEIILESSEMGLQGSVRSTLSYEFASDQWTKKKIKLQDSRYSPIATDEKIQTIRAVKIINSDSYLFDRSGRLIKEIRYADDGDFQMENIEQYIFNKRGQLIERNNTGFDNHLKQQHIFNYDIKGRLIEFTEIDLNSPIVFKSNITYVSDTILIDQVKIEDGNTITTYIDSRKYKESQEIPSPYYDPGERKKYDQKGNLIKMTYIDYGYKFPSYAIHYNYDFKGNMVRKTYYDSLNLVTQTNQFYYNEMNELLQEIEIDTSGTEIKRFNASANMYEYSWTPFNPENIIFNGFWTYYDQYGNQIKTIDLERFINGSFQENIKRIELEYDNFGNWISKKAFVNDTLRTRSERQIIYY